VGREWERVEEGEVSLQVPETKVDGSCHSKEGFQVSKGNKERGQKGISKWSKKQGDCAIYVVNCTCVYICLVPDVDNNLNCV
jgi:hypothetical protein